MKQNPRLAHLFDCVANVLASESKDSDAYLVDVVLPSIKDRTFASLVGVHGFVLVRALTIDSKNQTIEALLSHQERGTDVVLSIQGSYVRPHDGEWVVRVSVVGGAELPLEDHAPFEWDPKKDATSIMKAAVRLLGGMINA